MNVFKMCCPLIPYKKDFKRSRPINALDLESLMDEFSDSILFKKKFNELNIGVLHVLSPYTNLLHIMLMEMSKNIYLPSIELMSKNQWNNFCEVSEKILKYLINNKNEITNIGFNWSPYSYGEFEEIEGGQSITTKFHMMIFQWDKINFMKLSENEISQKHKILFYNNYNELFGKVIFDKIYNNEKLKCFLEKCFNKNDVVFNSLGLFLPFVNNIDVDFIFEKYSNELYILFNEIIENVMNITKIFFPTFYEDKLKIIKKIINDKNLLDKEIENLRSLKYELPTIEKIFENNNFNENLKKLIKILYESIENRIKKEPNKNLPIWKKGFALSNVFSYSKKDNKYSGLRVMLIPYCGSGGVAEACGCLLSRPENRIADDDAINKHKEMEKELSDYLNNNYNM